MDDVHQIKVLENDISILRGQIAGNNRDISRLKEAKNKIISGQDHLYKKQSLAKKPTISYEKWKGNHANEFLEIRDMIEQEFKTIVNLQIEVLLDKISIKLSQLEELNTAYKNKIIDKKSEINFYKIS